jgi:hypothetical protein
MSTKAIVTNDAALMGKYGNAGLKEIKAALTRLVKVDAGRNMQTRIIALDSQADMQKFGAQPVAAVNSERGTKLAIDAICRALDPAYVVLLGAGDVVCHVQLTNPVNLDDDPADDDDHTVPSDLPYACDAGFSRDIAKYLGPTRVIGRLPDVDGGTDASVLVGLIDKSAAQKPLPKADYLTAFAITADVWKGSTDESVDNIFGGGQTVHRCPPAGQPGIDANLRARSWFINCHGASADPKFYGEGPPKNFADALDSTKIIGALSPGTVVAAECCYGAQLYNPALTLSGVAMGICNKALIAGAIGFMGSTTIAYGPADGNGAADLITQYFLIRVLSGASLGRALLQSRQQFIQRESMSDPVNLKTLGQFVLLGDPSLQPCLIDEVNAKTVDGEAAIDRRRLLLKGLGKSLERSATFPVLVRAKFRAAGSLPVANLAKKLGYGLGNAKRFSVSGGADIRAAMKARNYDESIVTLTKRRKSAKGPRDTISVLVARLFGKSVISYTEYVSR